MPYDSRAIANYFLDLAERSGKKLDPMQLQKLVYFAHGWNLALNQAPLIDDTVEAWQYGPVIPTLYHEFKHFGRGPITRKASSLRFVDGDRLEFVEPTLESGHATQSARDLLDVIWRAYGTLTGVQLSNLTHEAGSPWYVTWHNAQGRKNVDIPDRLIQEHFARLLNGNAAA
jgi:uncharacterized phage-associated protein